MMNTRIRRSLAAAAIGVALFATLGEGSAENGSSDGGDNDQGSSGESSSDESAPAVGTEQSVPAPLGTEIEVAKDWVVKVDSAELDANATMAATNQLNTPGDGEQFVLVKVTVTNGSSDPDMPMTNVDLSLLPPTGVAIDGFSCFGEVPEALDSTAQMQPGATATGNLCFSVPVADAAGSVLLAEPTFTLDEGEDQRFFALS